MPTSQSKNVNKIFTMECIESSSVAFVDHISSGSDSEFDLEFEVDKAMKLLLPSASKEVYEKAYDTFKEWCNKKKITVVDQGVLMVYFSSAKMESYKPSTAWCIYSKLKSMLELNDGVDISKFKKLQMLLKRKSTGYRPKKSRILTLEDIYRFLKEAPDNNFLAVKVAMIVGVFGACRRMELVDMSVDDIEYIEGGIKIRVPKTKTKKIREFVLREGSEDVLEEKSSLVIQF
ncbi:hypothetical protein Bhyg_12412 [Pseudolycoriella hygida]|uniref:Tyr recombinase domain-containing protein n=1 Tax=Pseudolycoriella hygida TaxID=35572 RepID=A0A9Q0MYW1_9DIPT|nr:hypothetical protein Bhyg_12412 [Pseudolycoriella hygida]